MPIAYEETIQVVLDLLTRALKAEAEVAKLQERVKELEAQSEPAKAAKKVA